MLPLIYSEPMTDNESIMIHPNMDTKALPSSYSYLSRKWLPSANPEHFTFQTQVMFATYPAFPKTATKIRLCPF